MSTQEKTRLPISTELRDEILRPLKAPDGPETWDDLLRRLAREYEDND